MRLLIDTGPELRLQALHHRVTHVDGVLYTHLHADHTAGIDDLKNFNASSLSPLRLAAKASAVISRPRLRTYGVNADHRIRSASSRSDGTAFLNVKAMTED